MPRDYFDTLDVIESLINGQWSYAKEQTQYKCKRNAVKQAYRVGWVVFNLIAHEERQDLAVKYLSMFDKE